MPSAIHLAPGTVIGGDFRILRALSAGGMGAVYVAHQISTDQTRALKVMHPQLAADDRFRERFEQEARVGARIASAHVVQVIAAGVDPEGMPWIAMELLEGEDLAALLRKRKELIPDEVVEILRQVGHALGTAHAAGIVHRDIKPENIFLARVRSATSSWSVKILDFGIAKVLAQAGAQVTAAVGTPLWMAPEQTDPLSTVSPSTDVWSLGLLAYWLLTGTYYWSSANDSTASMQALLREVLIEPVVIASQRATQFGVVDKLPGGFDAWFARCVDRDPSARFPDAAQAVEALQTPGSSFFWSYEPAPPETVSALSAPGSLPLSSLRPPSGAVSARMTPRTAPVVAQAKRSTALPLVAYGTVVSLLLVASAAAVVRQQGWFQKQSVVQPLPPLSLELPTPEPSASASAAPSASAPEVVPAPPKPIVAVRPPPSASTPKLQPFNRAYAQRVVDFNARSAASACQSLPGPRAIALAVQFAPDGKVTRVTLAGTTVATATGTCASSLLRRTVVPPYEGQNETVTATVVMP